MWSLNEEPSMRAVRKVCAHEAHTDVVNAICQPRINLPTSYLVDYNVNHH